MNDGPLQNVAMDDDDSRHQGSKDSNAIKTIASDSTSFGLREFHSDKT
jgi:hypothetical protein